MAPPPRRLAGILLAIALTATAACGDDDGASAADGTADASTDNLFGDASTTATDTTPAATDGATVTTPTDTQAPADTSADAADVSPCDALSCGANASCQVDGSGARCVCDQGFTLEADACVPAGCADQAATTAMTVYDTTPLPGVGNPVREGFDPLLLGDTVRVVTEVERTAGEGALRLVVVAAGLVIDEGTLRLDGQATTAATVVGGQRVELELAPGFVSGRLAFEATVPVNGPPLAVIDARVVTPVNCPVVGSASGARIQFAGSRDPKHTVCDDMSNLRSLQLSDAIPDKDTSVYETRNGTFDGLSSSYKILTQMSLCLARTDDRAVSIAGSADGTRPWTIDNHLLIETFDGDPQLGTSSRTGAYVTNGSNSTAPSQLTDGTPIRMLVHASLPGDYTGSRSPSYFTFPAGVVRLDALLPVGQPVWLRFTGLDSGVAGHLSRLFITSAEPGVHVPECYSFRDCPTPTSHDGGNIQIRSGCVAGRCQAIPCASATACEQGQTCTQGFCNDGCASDSDCPGGEICGQGRCSRLDAGGCRTFADCPAGEMCLHGTCQAGCYHPVRQNPTYADNYVPYSLCISSPAACPRCPDPSTRCWYNYCRDCEIDAHCGAGQVCADYDCVTS